MDATRWMLAVPLALWMAGCEEGPPGADDPGLGGGAGAWLGGDGADAGGGGGHARGGTDEPPPPLDWRTTFTTVCASCHGAEAEGTAAAPQIRRPVAGFAEWVIRNGREPTGFPAAMPSFSAEVLPESALDGLIEWLRSFPKPADGEGLYEMYCRNCHGAGGDGGRVGVRITDELDDVHEQVREGEGGDRYGDQGEYMPAWSRDELTDADLDRIVEYLGDQPGGDDDDRADED